MTRDWDAMADTVADDISNDDRRRVVNGGAQHGRQAVITNMRAVADVGVKTSISPSSRPAGTASHSFVNAYLAICDPEAFGFEVLTVLEIDADDGFAAGVAFDPDDIDAAFTELDARYLSGEAKAHAHAWSIVAGAYTALNRKELPATTPDWVNLDHRRGATFAPGEMTAYPPLRLEPHAGRQYTIEAVHRMNSLGAVVTRYRLRPHGGFRRRVACD